MKKAEHNTREKVYNYIVKFITQNGYSPSIREICDGTDLRSTSSAYNQLLQLERCGKISMEQNKTRTIRVIGYEYCKKEK